VKNVFKGMILWVTIFFSIFFIFNSYIEDNNSHDQYQIAFSDFVKEVENKRVKDVSIKGYKVSGMFVDGRVFTTYSHPQYFSLLNKIIESNAKLRVVPIDDGSWSILGILLSWFPTLLFIAVYIFAMRKMQGGGGKAMGFGRSKAKLLKDKVTTKFSDVAGIDEAKSELVEVVEFLKNPDDFTKLGARIPKGVLLVGPPGTGKTLLAKAVAGEAGVPFLFMSGSDFVEMFVGVGASRVRDLFEQAKKNSPCIVFIDEIDAVAKNRGSGVNGGHDERDQTLNQLLVEMDGFESSSHRIVFIAATNRVDILDPAMLRPGRFDRKVHVSLPDVKGRKEILLVHMKNVKLTTDVVLTDIAKNTSGFSGADLANLVNEAAILAAVRKKKNVSMLEFDDAVDKIVMGKERRSMVVSDNEKSITAYHEGGHALVGFFVDDKMKPYKATIVPRANGALGFVATLPSEDQFMMTKKQLKNRICVALAGRLTEEIIFGEENITTGAQSDLRAANGIAKEMVLRYGMSDLGLIYGDRDAYGFSDASDDLKNKVDAEIKKILAECTVNTKKILDQKIDRLHLIAKYLLEKETLTGEQIRMIMEDGEIVEKNPDDLDVERNMS
jgi:cell division protease FtsH